MLVEIEKQKSKMPIGQTIARIILTGFACIGIVFVAIFFAMKLHLTDVAGKVDAANDFFSKTKNELSSIAVPTTEKNAGTGVAAFSLDDRCKWLVISGIAPDIATTIATLSEESATKALALKMLASTELYLSGQSGYTQAVSKCKESAAGNTYLSVYPWRTTPEWAVLREALHKEAATIKRAAVASGVPARMIVALVVPEQLRFYTSSREVYKSYFEPLKVLGNETQFSLGVSGVKDDTGAAIENHLKDPNSKYYLGTEFEHLLDFTSLDPTAERFDRLTAKDHYMSYVYTGLFVHEVEAQWQKSGFDLHDRPEILATIFNLGFGRSIPKADPEAGGAVIRLGEKDYTFGGLAFDFYYSGELSDDFPLE